MNIGQGVFLADPSEHLSGGDILNIGLNAIYADSVDANPRKWHITQQMLEQKIAKVQKAWVEHAG